MAAPRACFAVLCELCANVCLFSRSDSFFAKLAKDREARGVGAVSKEARPYMPLKYSGQSFDLYFGIEVGNPALRVRHSSFDQDVSFRPVNLYVARRDRRDHATPLHSAGRAYQNNTVSIRQAVFLRVVSAHEDVITSRAGQWIASFVNHAVELLAAPCREFQLRGSPLLFDFDFRESSAAT